MRTSGKPVITEYMDPLLIWAARLVRVLIVLLSVIVVAVFWKQMDVLLKEKQEYMKYERKYEDYETFLKQAELLLAQSELEESERYYRSAMELLPKAAEPYLGLAEVFYRAREYEEALKILEEYPGQEEEQIRSKAEELQDFLEIMGQSILYERLR